MVEESGDGQETSRMSVQTSFIANVPASFFVAASDSDDLKQEAQLMLTNPRDTFRSQVKLTKHGTVQYVRYGFLLVCYSNFDLRRVVFQIFDFKNVVTLKSESEVTQGHRN